MSKPSSATKISHALKVPYTAPSWPVISLELEESILDILIPLLHPIGECRDHAIKSSKGSKRRKNSAKVLSDPNDAEQRDAEINTESNMIRHLTVGFNSTVRRLESLCREGHAHTQASEDKSRNPERTLSVVLVCSSSLPDIMTAPLPLLAASASSHRPHDPAIRIVSMSLNGSSRMAQAMKQPRLNVLGLEHNVPGLERLEQILQDKIRPIDVPWIREATEWRYQSVQIDSQQVVSGERTRHGKRKRLDAEDT